MSSAAIRISAQINSMNNANLWAIIPAAGTGSRFGSERPKQYARLLDGCVLECTLGKLQKFLAPKGLLVAISEQDVYWESLELARSAGVERVPGGKERADSVENALVALEGRADDQDWVLVHDAARPCIEREDLNRLLREVSTHDVGGLLAVPVADTLKRADRDGNVIGTVDRTHLWHAQTPQIFRYAVLRNALVAARKRGLQVTDEASAIESAGLVPKLICGSRTNIKITNPEDLSLARLYCASASEKGEQS